VQDAGQTITHRWRDIIVFTQWNSNTQHTSMLLLRVEKSVSDYIMLEYLRILNRDTIRDPFWCYMAVNDRYLALQHKATYALRDLTILQERRAETVDFSQNEQLHIDYAKLHEIARHGLTVNEVLKVNIVMLHHILEHHNSFLASGQSLAQLHASVKTIRKNHQQLIMYSHMFESISLRATSYMDRLKNQIALTFNLVAQNEAHTSIEIARATKADSQAMKLTSLVALVFLPAMFVSAVFSTTFFDFDSDRGIWAMSNQFYV
jgi:hypothetical protein